MQSIDWFLYDGNFAGFHMMATLTFNELIRYTTPSVHLQSNSFYRSKYFRI